MSEDKKNLGLWRNKNKSSKVKKKLPAPGANLPNEAATPAIPKAHQGKEISGLTKAVAIPLNGIDAANYRESDNSTKALAKGPTLPNSGLKSGFLGALNGSTFVTPEESTTPPVLDPFNQKKGGLASLTSDPLRTEYMDPTPSTPLKMPKKSLKTFSSSPSDRGIDLVNPVAPTKDSDGDVGIRDGDKDISVSRDKENQLALRYRVPKKLANLSGKDLKNVSQWIDRQIRLSDDERTLFLQRMVGYRASWNDFIQTGMAKAFEWAHDVHIPMAFEKIKAMHARIYQAVLGIDPIFTIKPRNKVAEVQKQYKEDLLTWAIMTYSNKMQGWKHTIDQDIWNFTADGTSITKHFWDRDVRKFMDIKETEKLPLELDAHGNIVMEESEVEKQKIVYDGPMFQTVKLEDFYLVGNSAETIDDADLVAHRVQYTKSDLIKLTKLGFFNEDAVERLIKKVEPASVGSTAIRGNENLLKYLDDYVTGIDKTGSRAGINTYAIFETYFRYDIDNDGIDEELVAWREEGTGLILRMTYLERVGPGGLRPFTAKKFIPRQGQFYGIGLAEMLFGLNNEMDMLHNMRLDYGTLTNLPYGFYRAASGLNPQEMNIGPGKLIPTDNPQTDVFFPQMNGGTAYGFQEEAAVVQYADKASGITDITLGSTQGQGAARTATGASILAQASNAGLDIFIQRYQEGFKRNLHIIDLQLQALLPLGTIMRVLGKDGKDIYRQFTDRSAIKFEVDYELEGNSANSNKGIERETSMQTLQMLSNPIALQTGLVTPKNLYNAYKNVLQKLNYRNLEAYLTAPADVEENPYTGQDELSAIWAGVKLPKTVRDNHQGKLQMFEEFEQSDDFGLLDAEHLALYDEYKKWHEQMLSSISAQANNPAAQNQGIAPELTAQLAAGGGGLAQGGAPAQQMGDLISQGQTGSNR